MGGPLVKINGNVIKRPNNTADETINFKLIDEPYTDIDAELLGAEPLKRKYFNINRDKLTTFQIVPDRTVRNHHVDDLARALHELYTEQLERFDIMKLSYRPADHFAFDMVLNNEVIKFFMTVPDRWVEYTKTKITGLWPRVTIKTEYPDSMPSGKSVSGARLTLKNHNFYSLHTAKNDYRPLSAIFQSAKELKPGETARIQIIAQPSDRQQWEHDATQAYLAHKQGKPFKRDELSAAAFGIKAAEMADSVCREVYEFVTDFFSITPEKKKEQNILFSTEFGKMAMRNQQGITDATIRKIREPIFTTEVRITASSETIERSHIIVKSIGAAYNEITSTDNELVRKDVSARNLQNFVTDVELHKMNTILSDKSSILSSSELGKLMQLPGPELQDEYKIVEQIDTRETDLPAALLDQSGIWIGSVTRSGKEHKVHLPIGDLNDLCHVYTITGGKGQGKTSLAGRLAHGVANKEWVAIVIDPAKGEIGDMVEKSLGKERVLRYRFGIDKIGLDYREVWHGADTEDARDRMADSLVGFLEVMNDVDTGIQTERYLRAAAKSAPTGRVAEVFEILTNESYRKQLVRESDMDIDLVKLWTEFDSKAISDQRRQQILQPVYNRINIISGNSFLKKCMDTTDGLDFVNLIDNNPGKVIVLDISLNHLTRNQINIIGSLLMTKIDLAMALRKSIDEYPFFLICDEPHQYLRSALTWEHMATEARKWRMAPAFLFHGWDQLPTKLQKILKDSGPHYLLYNSAKHTYHALAEEIAPFTTVEALATRKHYAICALKFCGNTVPSFMAKMAPPP